jgi:hypothetical protein
MKATNSHHWFTGRNRWITLGSIAAVGITGAVALGANIGILNASNNTSVGKVDAAAELVATTAPATAPNTTTVDVYVTDPNSPTTSGAPTTTVAPGQEFAVDTAGTVTVNTIPGGITLGGVTPAAGWTWSLNQPKPTELTVTFKNGARTLEFTANLALDGTIQANVNEPIVTPASQTPVVQGGSTGGGEHESDHYEGGESDD